MTTGRPRCSAEALARDEPLFATASLVSAWILIQQPGAWGPEALYESRFPIDSARRLVEKADSLGIRILLIRQRPSRRRRTTVFLAHSGGDGRDPIMVSGTVDHPADLADLDLEGLADGRLPDFGGSVDVPVYLVCTHGRHDTCCADRGRPLFRALSNLRAEQTWESSHLGGDRFAGNLLVLPRGDYFGRIEPEEADGLVTEYEAGRIDLVHHRGRSTQPRLVQAAEHHLRLSLTLTGFEDLVLVEYRRTDHLHADVDFTDAGGRRHRVRVAARHLPEAFLTCRAPEQGRPVAYDLVAIESS